MLDVPLEILVAGAYIHENNLMPFVLICLVGIYLLSSHFQNSIQKLPEEQFQRVLTRFIVGELVLVAVGLFYIKAYTLLLVGILLSGFYFIVLQNKRYETLKNRLKEILKELF